MTSYVNYWTDRLAFKENVRNDLYPRLRRFIGKPLTRTRMDYIKEEVAQWLKELDDVVFDCEIKVDIDTSDDEDIIKFINVNPVDI